MRVTSPAHCRSPARRCRIRSAIAHHPTLNDVEHRIDLGSVDSGQVGVQQEQYERLHDLALEYAGPVCEQPEPIRRSRLRTRLGDEIAVDARGPMNGLEQNIHWSWGGLEVSVGLEAREDLPRDDFFARLRNEPVVDKDRRSRIAETAKTDLGLPESRLEFLPQALVSRLYVDIALHQSLEDEVLDQVGRG